MRLFSKPAGEAEALEATRVPEYPDLSEEQREKAEAVYAAYRAAVDGKSWRVIEGKEVTGTLPDGQEIVLDQTIAEMYSKEKKDTVNGWVHYALNVPPGNPDEVDEVRAEALFEEHFRLAAKVNYNNDKIPEFTKFAPTAQRGWLAAAQKAVELASAALEAVAAPEEAEATATAFSPGA